MYIKKWGQPLFPVVWLREVDRFRTLNWKEIKDELDFTGILNLFPKLEVQNF